MNNSRGAMEGGFFINNFGIPLKLNKVIAERTNRDLHAIDTSVTDTAFALGIEQILKEVAVLRMKELEDERAAIEANFTYSKAWRELHDLNEGLYDTLGYSQVRVAEENFILGFLEGYRMMKMIAENGE